MHFDMSHGQNHENLQRPLGQSTNGVKAALGCQWPRREFPCSLFKEH